MTIVSSLFTDFGKTRPWQRKTPSPFPIVLALHRVAQRSEMPEGTVFAAISDPLELHSYLKSHESLLGFSLAEISEVTKASNSLCLTFDDGYRDNLTQALPILEQYDMPATIFVTTGFVDRVTSPFESTLSTMMVGLTEIRVPTIPWVTTLGRFITGRQPMSVPPSGILPMRSPEEHQIAWNMAQRPLKYGSLESRTDYLEKLAELNNMSVPPPEPDLFLNWEEVRRLDRHPLITIGAHSHTHPRFDLASPGQIYTEAKTSKIRLEEELGHPVDLFSYPYGANSYLARKIVKATGFRCAFTTSQTGQGRKQYSNPMAIPRIDFRDA